MEMESRSAPSGNAMTSDICSPLFPDKLSSATLFSNALAVGESIVNASGAASSLSSLAGLMFIKNDPLVICLIH